MSMHTHMRTLSPKICSVQEIIIMSFVCKCMRSKIYFCQEHQTMKHGIDFGKRFSCCECDQVFQTNTQLRNHVQYHHQLLNPLECDMCGKFFKQETSLRGHIQNIHLQTKLKVCIMCFYWILFTCTPTGWFVKCVFIGYCSHAHQLVGL